VAEIRHVRPDLQAVRLAAGTPAGVKGIREFPIKGPPNRFPGYFKAWQKISSPRNS
jgi:hypothetical protein